jgi:predicted lipid-binding transport protein (Tim44 family)
MADGGGGMLGKLAQLVIGLIVVGMVLSALQAALRQLVPYIVIAALVAGVGWIIWRIVHSRRDHW